MTTALPAFGLGFRTNHYAQVTTEGAPRTDFFEIVSENFMRVGGPPKRYLELLRERYPVFAHGVGLSIAGSDPLREDYLEHLQELLQWARPEVVSDHLCWTTDAHRNSHDLLPVAFTEESLKHVCRRIDEVQHRLDHRLLIENPTAYVSFAGNEMDEATFLAELVRLTGCGLLLDVNNLFVNTMNLGLNPLSYLATLPPEGVGYFHLAGHSIEPDVRIDTHDDHVASEVWALYAVAVRRFPQAPTVIEWDDKVPELQVLEDELDKARAVHRESVGENAPLLVDLEHSAAEIIARTKASESRSSAGQRPSERASSSRLVWPKAQKTMLAMVEQVDNLGAEDSRITLFQNDLPVERLRGINVYNNAYFFRLRDILAEATPALHNVVGASEFTRLASRYFATHPPSSYNVKYLGEHLAHFLSECNEPFHGDMTNIALSDLAALEIARFDVFDAVDGEPALGIDALQKVSPDDWAGARFSFRPGFRIVGTTFDIWNVWAAADAGETPPYPSLEAGSLLVYRNEHGAVYHQRLTSEARRLLEAISSGANFETACVAYAGGEIAEESGETMQEIVMLLGQWLNQGMISAISTSSQPI